MNNIVGQSFTIRTIIQGIMVGWKRIAVAVLLSGVCTFSINLFIPNYYRSDDVMHYEFKTSHVYEGLYGMLARMGFDTGRKMNNSDAISPGRYLTLIYSNEFLKSVMAMKITTSEGEVMDYYSYLQLHPQRSFWKKIGNLFSSENAKLESIDEVDPFMLTEHQSEIFEAARKNFLCRYVTENVYISVYDEDPLVSAIVAGQTQQMLKSLITQYRIGKNCSDAAFYDSQVEKAKMRYQHALNEYGDYCDKHSGNTDPSESIQKDVLEQQQLQCFREYQAIWMQALMSHFLVQDRTPVFIPFDPSHVASKSLGPKRLYTTCMVMLVVFLLGVIYTIRKEILVQLK